MSTKQKFNPPKEKQRSSNNKSDEAGEKKGKGDGQKKKASNQFKGSFNMSDQEKQQHDLHMQQLNSKYRDRAKERRQGKFEIRQEQNLNDDGQEEEQEQVILKGLDFDLFRDLKSGIEQQEIQTIENKQKLSEIKQNIFQAKQIANKEPGKLAKSVLKALKQDKIFYSGLFPKPFSYYRYEIKSLVSSDIPDIVIKQKHQDQLETTIAQINDNCLDKLGRIMMILKAGGRQKLREERDKIKAQKEKEEQLNKMEEEDDSDDIFNDVPKQKQEENKEIKKEGALFKESEKIQFDEKNITLQKIQSSVSQRSEQSQENKNTQQQVKKKRNVLEEEDYYGECFQESAPNMAMLKQMKVDSVQNDKDDKKAPKKKENFDLQFKKIEKYMEDNKKK